MDQPTFLRFKLLNGITPEQIKQSSHVVYAHSCSDGMYIGQSYDTIRRWGNHISSAFNPHHAEYNTPFKVAIRKFQSRFEHYILAVSSSEKIIKNKEAAAILYYDPKFNSKTEQVTTDRDYGFKAIDGQIPVPHAIKKQSVSGTRDVNPQRKTLIKAQIYWDNRRKKLRVKSTPGQPFPAGLNVECTSDRSSFKNGDFVKIRVALSSKRGKQVLVADKTEDLKPW